ncbi:MAG: ThiS family [Clostridia bacterium]|nr:ThiS family [Clostridia bacterium]
MEISINNKIYKAKDNSTVMDILNDLGFSRQVAVWVNEYKLLQKEYPTYRLQPGDKLKIIKPLVGG